MREFKSSAIILDKAAKAMRSAVRKVLAEKKLRGEPAIVWRKGKVVKISAKQLTRL